MMLFLAANWSALISGIERLRWISVTAALPEATQMPAFSRRQFVTDRTEILSGLKSQVAQLPFSRSLKQQIDRVCERAEADEASIDFHVLVHLIDEVKFNLHAELEEQVFLIVQPRWREFGGSIERPNFGESVSAMVPLASRDIADAARCLAVEQWTAAVFHSMRALEHALRVLADRVGLTSDAMAHENWKNVIDQIEKKILALEGLPKGSEKAETLKRYSRAAVQFRYFKDAWRNHVVHSRDSYDEREADAVFSHVRDFMRALAADA